MRRKFFIFFPALVISLVQGCSREEFFVRSDEKGNKSYIKVKRENESVIMMRSGVVNEKSYFLFEKYTDCIFMDSKNWECIKNPSPGWYERVQRNGNIVYINFPTQSFTFVKE